MYKVGDTVQKYSGFGEIVFGVVADVRKTGNETWYKVRWGSGAWSWVEQFVLDQSKSQAKFLGDEA